MSVIQVGLVDMTGKIDTSLMQAAAAALNLQVTRDLPQFWPINATVAYLPSAKHVPTGVWPIQLVAKLPPGEGGFHMDKHNQPYAKVIASPKDDTWTIDASHELIEMLVDPWGNRMQSSVAIHVVGNGVQDGTGQFSYLVEACDPCEANQYGYTVNGVLVSDFITPHYYDPTAVAGTRYSFNGSLTGPRQMLPGGYISFVNEALDEWQQILWVDPNQPPQLRNLGPAGNARSLRAWIDGEMAKEPHRKHIEKAMHEVAGGRMEYADKRRADLFEIAARRGTRFAGAHP
ncbi:MAG: hypothetical protein JSR21_13750 [Proteobacteria bacterium]|nr:hypothetical protein [Pseudomonadota bacterium]